MKTAQVVGVASVILALLLSARVLIEADGDPTAFLSFGATAGEITELAEDRLGRDVFVREDQGHDGKFFFVQALDPWLNDFDSVGSVLDRPLYRAQRILYPAVASGFGLIPDALLPWTMIFTNAVGMGLGGYASARILERWGASGWWGLAFPLNLGLLAEMTISGAGVLALAAAFLGVMWIQEDRRELAVLAMSASVLARESMLIFVVGLALFHWKSRSLREALPLVVGPAAAGLLWAGYLRIRIDSVPTVDQVQELGPPFVGILDAVDDWQLLDAAVAVIVLAVGAMIVWSAALRPSPLSWGAVGFVLLLVVLTEQVWTRYFNIARAAAPIFTCYVLVRFPRQEVPAIEMQREPYP